MTKRTFHAILFPAVCALAAACGGDDGSADGGAVAEQPDTSIRSVVREPLTAADLAGLEQVNLLVEVPWTVNRVTRDPAPAAARAALLEVTTSEHDTFDRVLFTFSDGAPFPGYKVRVAETGGSIVCGENELQADVVGGVAHLVIGLGPARAHEGTEVRVPVRSSEIGVGRFLAGGLVCDNGETPVWIAGLREGAEVRVLEMLRPNRLVVDVR